MKTLVVSFVSSTAVVLGSLASLQLAARPDPQPSAIARASLKLPLVVPSTNAVVAPVLTLEPLRVIGRVPRAIERRSVRGPELVPCSDWRSIGPVFTQRPGEPVRERHVQLLCPAH